MTKFPKIACFYLLPKILKNMQVTPGRPIVSGKKSLCEPICKYLDLYLKPFVELLPSYACDTGDVIHKIENIHLDNNMWIVTLDVDDGLFMQFICFSSLYDFNIYVVYVCLVFRSACVPYFPGMQDLLFCLPLNISADLKILLHLSIWY